MCYAVPCYSGLHVCTCTCVLAYMYRACVCCHCLYLAYKDVHPVYKNYLGFGSSSIVLQYVVLHCGSLCGAPCMCMHANRKGLCTFCGTQVALTFKDRQAAEEAAAVSTASTSNAGTVGGTGSTSGTDCTTNDAVAAARAFKDRLVQYDREAAKRTTVIDDQSDYFEIDTNQWLSDQVRVWWQAASLRNAGCSICVMLSQRAHTISYQMSLILYCLYVLSSPFTLNSQGFTLLASLGCFTTFGCFGASACCVCLWEGGMPSCVSFMPGDDVPTWCTHMVY